jgi:hypothetical protein
MVMISQLAAVAAAFLVALPVLAQGDDASRANQSSINRSQAEREAVYSAITTIEWPEAVVPEVSGILPMGGGRTLVCTRRGELWMVREQAGSKPAWTLYADGLLEPMGLARKPGDDQWIYMTQRGEFTRFRDADGDGRGDVFETVQDGWDISGNYHEYAFGPAFTPDGSAWVTLNRGFGEEPFGRPRWRGWAVRIAPDGSISYECAGLRSPCGVGVAPWGDVFYTDNQGEWCATSKLSQLVRGDYHGHPFGVDDTARPESLVKWPAPNADGSKGEHPNRITQGQAAQRMPNYRLPAVWLPFDKAGRSPGNPMWLPAGSFGPFAGQCLVPDQYAATINRIDLEQVDGQWQGAVFPFRHGFDCGIIRIALESPGTILCGETNRGWASAGSRSEGLQRLSWKGEVPFEIMSMRATPSGFRITTTQPVDRASALDPTTWSMSSYTYWYFEPYGSPEIETKQLVVTPKGVSEDGLVIELSIEGLRPTFVHELRAAGLKRAGDGEPLLHDLAMYTLNRIPKP